MRMKQLKALEKVYKNPPKNIMKHEDLQHVFMVETCLYVTNSVTLIEVHAEEFKGDNASMFGWQALDLISCEADEHRNRYVDINKYENLVRQSEMQFANDWKRDKFSRMFDCFPKEILEGKNRSCSYDAKQLALVVNVFSAFGINPKFHMISEDTFMLSGKNDNYSIRALIAPIWDR